MGIEPSKLADKPIVHLKFTDPYDPEKDVQEAFMFLGQQLQLATEKLFLLVDVSKLHLGFSDMMIGMQQSLLGNEGVNIHSDAFAIVVIGSDMFAKLGTESYKQDQYGALDIPFFESYDEGLAYIESEMAK